MNDKPTANIADTLAHVKKHVLRLGVLYIEKARLKTTEKLTILLSTVAFSAILAAIAIVFLVFVSIGVGHLLATSIAPHLAYLLVAGVYLILLIVVACMRRRLFINPIARFMSRLLVEAPVADGESDEHDTKARPHAEYETPQPEIDYDVLARHVVDLLNRQNDETAAETSFDDPDLNPEEQ